MSAEIIREPEPVTPSAMVHDAAKPALAPWYESVVAIVVALFIAWPIGLILLTLRVWREARRALPPPPPIPEAVKAVLSSRMAPAADIASDIDS